MAITSYPKVGGSTTDAQYAELFESVVGSGVRDTGDFAVTAGSGLTVNIATGFAVVNGVAYKDTATNSKTLGAANATNPRIDTIALVRDTSQTLPVNIVVIPGTAAATPAPASLTQTVTGIWQEPLAYITVAANASSVGASNITDARRYIKRRVGIWTTATRPTRPGDFGYNTTLGQWEGLINGTWTQISSDWNTLANKPTTFPPATHTHSFTDITSGTASVAQGGTGATSAASARTNLGLGSLSTLNSVSLTTNVTGLLPVANGGTGGAVAADARANLGLGSISTLNSVDIINNTTGTLSVARGGTGATDAATARANLGITSGSTDRITNGSSTLVVGSDSVGERLYTSNNIVYGRGYDSGFGFAGTDTHIMAVTSSGTFGYLAARIPLSYMNQDIPGSYLVSAPSFDGVVAMDDGITSDNVRSRAVATNYVSVYVESSGRFGYNSSSRDTKHDIKPLINTITPEMVLSIEPKTFVYNDDDSDTINIGMIAEDVQEAGLGYIVPVDADGKAISINYEHMVAPLLLVVRDQAEKIAALTERVSNLEGSK